MRILQLAPHFGKVGGIQHHVVDLSRWLRQRDHEVWIAGGAGEWLNEEKDDHFIALALDRVAHLEDADPATNRMTRRLANAFKCARAVRKLITRERIELIHAHETAAVVVAWLATLGRRTPIVFTYHGSEPERVREVGRISGKFATAIIALSQRASADLHKIGGVAKEKLNVMGLGIKAAPRVDEQIAERKRQELLGSEECLLVVTVARLCQQKGIDVLIEVVKRVLETRRDIRFVVVGDGPLENEVEEWSRSAGTQDRLTFAGFTTEPQTFLAAADFFLLTSRWEALPISIAEAFRSGLPVIACDTGGVQELVTQDVGYVAPVEDVDALTGFVLKLAEDEGLRRRMQEEALSYSQSDRFSPEQMNRKIEELYGRLSQG